MVDILLGLFVCVCVCLFVCLFVNRSLPLVSCGQLLRYADKRIANVNDSVHRK